MTKNELNSELRFVGFAECTELTRFAGSRPQRISVFTLIIKHLRVAVVLLVLDQSRIWQDVVAATEGGTMRSAKLYTFRSSSKRCSTCEHLRGLNARIEVALRNPRNRYSA